MADDFYVKGGVRFDSSQVNSAAQAIGGSMNRAMDTVASRFRRQMIGALTGGGFVTLITKTVRESAEIQKKASKFGIDPQIMATLSRLATQTGAEVADLANQYLNAKEKGGEFAQTIEAAMTDLLNKGLIPTTDQIDKMASAMQKLADIVDKLGPAVGSGAKWMEDPSTFFTDWYKGIAIINGKIGRMIGNVTGIDWFKKQADRSTQYGYGIGEFDTTGQPKTDTPKSDADKAKDQIIKDLQFELWWERIGGNQNWTSSKEEKAKDTTQNQQVSSAAQIGLFWTKGMGSMTEQEYQLKLINRQMADLVATVKRGQL